MRCIYMYTLQWGCKSCLVLLWLRVTVTSKYVGGSIKSEGGRMYTCVQVTVRVWGVWVGGLWRVGRDMRMGSILLRLAQYLISSSSHGSGWYLQGTRTGQRERLISHSPSSCEGQSRPHFPSTGHPQKTQRHYLTECYPPKLPQLCYAKRHCNSSPLPLNEVSCYSSHMKGEIIIPL